MYKNINQSRKATIIYSRERLETVKCIGCEKNYQIKIVEHETKINNDVQKYETLYDIFCGKCGIPYIGIN